ncbi:MAG: hypothetical protein NC548_34480 [Lachnospiraceae bacterium]|nr:hypothetical protein [Lachnospiraceae bacterium]
MAISEHWGMNALNEMFLGIENYPDNAEEIKLQFLRYITKSEQAKTINVLATILSKIYDFDHDALKADMSRIIMLDAEKTADRNERANLLRCMMSVVDFFVKGDYSALLNYIDSLCDDGDDCDYAELPFT